MGAVERSFGGHSVNTGECGNVSFLCNKIDGLSESKFSFVEIRKLGVCDRSSQWRLLLFPIINRCATVRISIARFRHRQANESLGLLYGVYVKSFYVIYSVVEIGREYGTTTRHT